jgi:hypothetical protein
MSQTDPGRGLIPQVRGAARKALTNALPIWLAEPAEDLKRVVRRTGPGSFSINIEPYRGPRSWIAFDKKLSAQPAILHDLEVVIMACQPELVGYLVLPGRSQLIQNARALVSTWCQLAAIYLQSCRSEDEAIDKVLTDLDSVLGSRRLLQTVSTALTGLQLPTAISFGQLVLEEVQALFGTPLCDIGFEDYWDGHQRISKQQSCPRVCRVHGILARSIREFHHCSGRSSRIGSVRIYHPSRPVLQAFGSDAIDSRSFRAFLGSLRTSKILSNDLKYLFPVMLYEFLYVGGKSPDSC